MTERVLDAGRVTKRFGGFTALDEVDLHVHPGERVGLIGPNGSGKSTLVNCITGILRNEEGRIAFRGRDVTQLAPYQRTRLGLARSFQIPKPFVSMSVLDNLRVPLLYAASRRGEGARLSDARARDEAHAILAQFGLAARADELSGVLSQVEMRKLELARAMASRPTLLISDEAMAGLSTTEVDEILELLAQLKDRGVSVIMIEHVMRAVMKFSERLVVLVAGRKIADGEPESVVANADVIRAYLGE